MIGLTKRGLYMSAYALFYKNLIINTMKNTEEIDNRIIEVFKTEGENQAVKECSDSYGISTDEAKEYVGNLTNDLIPENEKWYDKIWLVALLIIVFFPVGLYALHKSSNIKKFWKTIITVIVVLLIIVFITNKYKNRTPATVPTEQTNKKAAINTAPKVVQASKYYTDYKSNATAADKVYKGNTIEITGKVASMSMDLTKHFYIILSSNQEWTDEVFVYVQDPEKAQNIAIGDIKTFIGKGSGIIDGTPTVKNAAFK
jgi:hypothetical protein